MSLRSTFSKAKNNSDSDDQDDFDDEDVEDLQAVRSSRKGLEPIGNDEEMGADSYSDSDSESESESDSDGFDDEASTSAKDRLRSLLQKHKYNPRSRMICLVLLLLILLLVIVIPVTTRKKGSKQIEPSSQTGTPVISGDECFDEIVLMDKNGNDLVNGTATSENVACYTMDEAIHFRFKRCRPASPLDWVGVFPSRSMFMNKLWKDHYDGVYLCGDQPCPNDDPANQEGGPPREKNMKAPPINMPGMYRLFLVKDSDWPYEFVDLTPTFHVVEERNECANKDNIFDPVKPSENPGAKSVYIDLPTEVPTAKGSADVTSFVTVRETITGSIGAIGT